jgi:hypothetical protein
MYIAVLERIFSERLVTVRERIFSDQVGDQERFFTE